MFAYEYVLQSAICNDTYEWAMSHENGSCLTYEHIMPSAVCHHTHEWAISCENESNSQKNTSRHQQSVSTHMNESCHPPISHASHVNASLPSAVWHDPYESFVWCESQPESKLHLSNECLYCTQFWNVHCTWSTKRPQSVAPQVRLTKMYTYIYTNSYISIHMHIYTYMYIHIYSYIHIYIHLLYS